MYSLNRALYINEWALLSEPVLVPGGQIIKGALYVERILTLTYSTKINQIKANIIYIKQNISLLWSFNSPLLVTYTDICLVEEKRK